MPKNAPESAPAPAPAPLPMPATGGSWVRQPDGTLVRQEPEPDPTDEQAPKE